jgi:hypothetical protein
VDEEHKSEHSNAVTEQSEEQRVRTSPNIFSPTRPLPARVNLNATANVEVETRSYRNIVECTNQRSDVSI